jgi:hypothetical protein
MAKDTKKAGLLRYLTFDKEARTDGTTSAPIGIGRIKYFWNLFTKRNGEMMVPSLLFLITAIPLFAAFIFLRIYGVEELTYKLSSITDLPYFMTNIGIGISSSSDVILAKINMLKVYQIYYLITAFGIFLMSIGLAGIMRISAKFVWNDSFITKKDTYGNNVPRLVLEYFKGIQKYWWQMLIFGAIAMILVAGVSNSIIYFVSNLWLGTAGAGTYILLIFACLVGLIGAMFLLYLAPFIVMYDISFLDKMKNSIILAFQMFLPNMFVLIVIAIPIVIAAVSDGFLNVLIVALMVVFGATFYSMLTCTYLQYYSEKIINPVYSAQYYKIKKKKIK